MGGEKFGLFIFCQPLIGSPPHGRGKGCAATGAARPCWITPAWAGKSQQYSKTSTVKEDHPRMGGEKQQ